MSRFAIAFVIGIIGMAGTLYANGVVQIQPNPTQQYVYVCLDGDSEGWVSYMGTPFRQLSLPAGGAVIAFDSSFNDGRPGQNAEYFRIVIKENKVIVVASKEISHGKVVTKSDAGQ